MADLPVLDQLPDPMRHGVSRLQPAHAERHPVERIETKNAMRQPGTLDAASLAAAYGAHMPMRLAMDTAILSQGRRAPGLPTSDAGLDTLLNRDEGLEFADVLGHDPDEPGRLPRTTVGEGMEARMGWKPLQ